MDECLYAFLLSHNENNEELAVEDGYNLEEACSRFAHEPHIALFSKILSEEQDEDVFHYWLNTQTTLTEAFSNQQQEEVIQLLLSMHNVIILSLIDYCVELQGLVGESTLCEIISSRLPGKPEHHLKALVASATHTASAKPGMVDFIKLMSPVRCPIKIACFCIVIIATCSIRNYLCPGY